MRAKSAAERQSAGVEAVMESPAAGELAPASAEEPTTAAGDRVPHEPGAVAGTLPVQLPEPDAWLIDTTEAEPHVADLALPAVSEFSAEAAPTGIVRPAGQPDVGEPMMERRSTPVRSEKIGGPAAGSRAIEEADSAMRLVDSDEGEILPDWYRTELPRICRTCRDYRPSADGQRGWCANTWAFTHRRLVLEDDPAPCQSAIGDWWLAVDDVWLVAADVSSHGRATPLLDRLAAKAEQQRRRS